MVNNTPESKLDETVKDALNNYEATYEADDWSRMENMLNTTSKSSSFKWSYVVKIAVALVVIASGYLIYNAVNFPEVTDEVTTNPVSEPVKDVVKVDPNTTVPVPPVVPPKVNTQEVEKEVAKQTTAPDKIEATSPVIEKIKAEEKQVVKKEERPKDKKTKKEKEAAEENATKHMIIMGNEPVFGDMLDSSKGVVGETKEKEETKKAAKAKKDLPVGWDNFMLKNVNPDSIKKYRERRDSLKNQ